MQVLARMQLVAHVHASLIEGVEQGTPSLSKLAKRRLDQALRTLWPRIQIRPGQRARKRHMRAQIQTFGRGRCVPDLLDRPRRARLRIAANVRCCEAIEKHLVCRLLLEKKK